MDKLRIGFIGALLMVTTLLTGCGGESGKPVSLSKTDPAIVGKDKAADRVPLRVAVSSIVSPKETLTVYQPLVDYLEEKLEQPVVLLQRKTYKEVNDLVQNGGADLAFVCSGGYVAGAYSFNMELLATPQVKGKRLYQSYIIARDQTFRSILDLSGKSFAFTDPMSFSGRIAPVHMLMTKGVEGERFFSRTFFTYSHDNAIQAVADGIVDAAAVDSMIFDRAVEKSAELGRQVVIIDRSLSVGNPPVVVNPYVDTALKQRLQTLLLTMHEDERGQNALTALAYDKLVAPDNADYAHLKNVWLSVREKL